MSVMSLQLVSAGDDIKIWDCNDFVLAHQFNPHNENIGSVCWAADNSFLVSGSIQSEDVVLTDMKSLNTSNIRVAGGCTCLDVNNTSRYMLTGAANGIVSVWDLKSSKIRKSYKEHKGPVTSARFNEGSTSIAAGSKTGEIILYNVVTGQGCRPLVTKNVQSIQEVRFSRNKKSLLGSVSDDGGVNLWDCNTRQLVHSFACHQAPATGLSFSPINEIFLISVGLDKKITCIDVQKKKVVKCINVDAPLTSVDTMSNGISIAVGSTRGKIYHYDLRMESIPFKVIEAHKSSVRQLQYQMEVTKHDSPGQRPISATNKQLKQRQLPASPRDNYNELGPLSPAQQLDARGHGVETDVFSPLREGYLDNSGESSDYTSEEAAPTSVPGLENGSGDMYAGGVFSPLHENLGRDSGSIGLSPLAFPNISLKDRNKGSPGLSETGYHHNVDLPVQSSIPSVNLYPATPLSRADDGQPSYNVLANGLPVSSHVTSSGAWTTPREGLVNSSDRTRPFNELRQTGPPKQVAFVTDDPDIYTFSNNSRSPSYSSNGHGQSPELPDHRYSHNQHIGTSASPALHSIHLDDSPGSAYGGTNGASKNLHPITPDGVNAQSVVPSNFDIPSERRLDTNNNGNRSLKPIGDSSEIAQIVRSVVQEEFGAMKRELKGIITDKVEGLADQIKELKNTLKEELEDVMYQTHRDIVNLQGVILLEFQAHQNEMIQLLEHYSVNQDLVSEITRLQEQVNRLQKNF